jgi:hypothetical protein
MTVSYEDVELGDELPAKEMTIDSDEVLAFLHVWRGRPTRENSQARQFAGRFSDPEIAKAEGLRGPMVPGAMSMSLAGVYVTNWCGPDAFHQLDVVFRANIIHGDRLRFGGVITDKDLKDGRPWVEVDVYAEDEEGNRPITGKAVVILPSRAGDPS